MSADPAQTISGKHLFDVLDATAGYDGIVEKGDEQLWLTPPKGEPGSISVTNRECPFWKDKEFFEKAPNQYIANYTDNGSNYSITLTFVRGLHMTSHKPVWIILGTRNQVPECELGGPPNWGGQNEN